MLKKSKATPYTIMDSTNNAMVIIRSFGIAETTSFFRIAVPSFYRLSRQSVANPFPPATCDREIGIRFCRQNRMVCFTFRTALFLVFCLP